MGQYDVLLHVENRRMDGLSTYHSCATSTITLLSFDVYYSLTSHWIVTLIVSV